MEGAWNPLLINPVMDAMNSAASHHLPGPAPEGSVLLGPASWLDMEGKRHPGSQIFADPESALAWLARHKDGDLDSGQSRLLLLHQDAFAAAAWPANMEFWLANLTALRSPHLPILLHDDQVAGELVSFFRVGLFDALAFPVERSEWVNMLIRSERRLEHRQQSRMILAKTGQTQDILRKMRRQLEEETARSTGELLLAQESLEAANEQLSQAMAELSLLYRFGRELSTARNWDKALREILQRLADFMGSSGAALVLRSAPGGTYAPRLTWQWEEKAWDKVLVNLQSQVDVTIAERIIAPGVYRVDHESGDDEGPGRGLIALPLEHQEVRLGYLLLMFESPQAREKVSARFWPFLQTFQVVLGEEVANAQMLDRIRDIGSFNASLLETVSSAIWVIDEQGHTVFCNRAGQGMLTGQAARAMDSEEFLFRLGRGRKEEEGTSDQENLPEIFGDGRLRLDQHDGLVFSLLRDESGDSFRGEGRIIGDNGSGIPVLIQTSKMAGRSQEENWLVVVAEDLRESRKLEVERLRADRLESLVAMSATLAHEIRNPLMGLSAQAELLAAQLAPEDKRSRYLEVITREVERINDTITRMLNFVRPYEPVFNQTSLLDLAADSLELVQARAQAKNLELEFTTPTRGASDQTWDLIIDGSQIKQVLLNLLINAIDAAPTNGLVQLRLVPDRKLELLEAETGFQRIENGIMIEVADNGPGIAEADLSRIFRPFFTTKSSGTGLGLSICQKIVAAHRGQIKADRQNGQTLFRVLLPLVAGQDDSDQRDRHQEENA